MENGKELPSGSGFISPGGRIFFFCLALIPGTLMVLGALLTEAPDLFIALSIGLLIFIPSILVLLLIGRSVEYYRDREWRASPDSLSNAPRRVRVLVFALVAITCIALTIQLRSAGTSWWVVVPMIAWNALCTWFFAHFFAMPIIRFIEGLTQRGKQSL